jgi:cyclopropane-fatty-acyl-phospholipid synthase
MMGTSTQSAATTIEPMITAILKREPPVRIELWDGSALGPDDHAGVIRIASPDAFRRITWAPGELGFSRAFVVGDVDIDGPVAEVLRTLQQAMPGDVAVGAAALSTVAKTAHKLGALGPPLPAPPEEHIPLGLRHSLRRDKGAVSHHYDVGNDFYSIVLGPSMTYSCARFIDDDTDLTTAQEAKHELICRKLGLTELQREPGGARPRLLDVGCGWGSMAIHAATHHDVDVVGVTISDEQAALARRRVAAAGLDERVEIRLQDYREIDDGPFDAISSIGMAEHVGKKPMVQYFELLNGQLRPGGRMMNHAIGSIGGTKLSRRSFVGRYVFPDGELLDLADTITAMQRAGFEVRDVENLREHYARTLQCWVENLEAQWDAAVELVGERRARVWQLYMSGSLNGFYDGGLQIYQTLGVRRDAGRSHMPATRRGWD